MTADDPSVVLVVLIGPQASGKSTLASALATALRRREELVALVELDQIAAMARPTLPSWEVAAHIFAVVAGEWARSELTCVIAEGIASLVELDVLLDRVPAHAAVVTVLLTTPFEVAARRARADPARAPSSSSRDREWLADRYEEWSLELSRIHGDLLLDTSATSPEESMRLVLRAIDSAR